MPNESCCRLLYNSRERYNWRSETLDVNSVVGCRLRYDIIHQRAALSVSPVAMVTAEAVPDTCISHHVFNSAY